MTGLSYLRPAGHILPAKNRHVLAHEILYHVDCCPRTRKGWSPLIYEVLPSPGVENSNMCSSSLYSHLLLSFTALPSPPFLVARIEDPDNWGPHPRHTD